MADGTADLQRRPLPSGGAAAQVSQQRSQKNRGQKQNREPLILVDRIDDVVGSHALGAHQLVGADNGKSRQRQAPQQPGIGQPCLCRVVNAQVKNRSDTAAERTHSDGQYQPLCQSGNIQPDVAKPLPDLVPFKHAASPASCAHRDGLPIQTVLQQLRAL